MSRGVYRAQSARFCLLSLPSLGVRAISATSKLAAKR